MIYAFVVKDEVKYIGICDRRNLKQRMNSYKSGETEKAGSTNKKVLKLIKNELNKGEQVLIYAVEPNDF